jgi:hypothetical protein
MPTRVSYRIINSPAHTTLTVWSNGAHLGELRVRTDDPDEMELLNRLISTLAELDARNISRETT